MKIAVVILNWNGKTLLEKFLPSIIRYSNPEYVDIYIADNASTDDSLAFVAKNFSSVKIVANDKNYGFAKGYNLALREIKADVYALVNSDVEVTENWLKSIVEMLNSKLNTAIIQPKILDYKDKTKFEYAGAAGGFIDNLGYPYCRGRIFNSLEKDNNQYNDELDIFWASGACFFIRSEVFHKLNGFDATYFAHQEEIDLCWRVKNLGYSITYNPKSVVYHIGGATLKDGSTQKTFLNFRNNLLTLVKNLPKKKIVRIILLRLFLDGVAGVKFLFEGKPLHTLAIIKAHFSLYTKLSKTLKKRKEIHHKIPNYYQSKGIVKQYFFSKRKTFREIR